MKPVRARSTRLETGSTGYVYIFVGMTGGQRNIGVVVVVVVVVVVIVFLFVFLVCFSALYAKEYKSRRHFVILTHLKAVSHI